MNTQKVTSGRNGRKQKSNTFGQLFKTGRGTLTLLVLFSLLALCQATGYQTGGYKRRTVSRRLAVLGDRRRLGRKNLGKRIRTSNQSTHEGLKQKAQKARRIADRVFGEPVHQQLSPNRARELVEKGERRSDKIEAQKRKMEKADAEKDATHGRKPIPRPLVRQTSGGRTANWMDGLSQQSRSYKPKHSGRHSPQPAAASQAQSETQETFSAWEKRYMDHSLSLTFVGKKFYTVSGKTVETPKWAEHRTTEMAKWERANPAPKTRSVPAKRRTQAEKQDDKLMPRSLSKEVLAKLKAVGAL